MRRTIILIVSFLTGTWLYAACSLDGYNTRYYSTDFWVAFIYEPSSSLWKYTSDAYPSTLSITALSNRTAHVSVNGGTPQTITANSAQKVFEYTPPTFSRTYPSTIPLTISNAAYHVESDVPIAVVASNINQYLSDECKVIATDQLGTEYIVQTAKLDTSNFDNDTALLRRYAPQCVIIATENNTAVHIVPQEYEGGSLAGKIWDLILQQGETVYLSGVSDLSGTYISSDKPIAVFQGAQGTQMPDYRAFDGTYEQAVPCNHWGKTFAVINNNPKYEYVKITAKNSNTQVYINGIYTTTLSACKSYWYKLENHSMITTSDVVEVIQYLGAGGLNEEDIYGLGDPSSFTITPLEQGKRNACWIPTQLQSDDTYYIPPRSNTVIITTWETAPHISYNQGYLGTFTAFPGNDSLCYKIIENCSGYSTLGTEHGWFVAYYYNLVNFESTAFVLPEMSDTVEIRDTVCVVPYLICDTAFYKSGTYIWDNSTALNRSTIKLLLEYVDTTTATDTTIYACLEHRPLAWRGWQLTAYGDYTDTIVNTGECFSTLTLHLLPPDPSTFDTVATVCQRDLPYRWRARNLMQSGTYADTLITPHGCDSIVTLQLTVVPTVDSLTTATVCYQDLPYTWFGQIITATGDYYHTEPAGTLCDNHYTLHLLVDDVCHEVDRDYPLNPYIPCDTAYSSLDTTIYCDSLLWFDKWYYTSGTYHDTLIGAAANLCDSVGVLNLEVIDNSTSSDTTAYTCYGVPFIWHGKEAEDGDTIRRKNVVGCDSIVTLRLYTSAAPTTQALLDTSSCTLVPFLWRGHQIISDTLCYDTLRTTMLGCDSIYASLRFKTYPTYNNEVNLTVCDKQMPYTWNGIRCELAGDYVLDSATVLGCDSIVTLHLSVDTYSASDTSAYICFYDQPYLWHGKIAQDGDTIHLINSVGCDSIVTLRLFVSEATVTIPLKDTASCQMVPFLWRGHTIVGDTLCYDTIRTAKLGCDSIYASLRFVVKEPSSSDTSAYVCYEDLPFIWHGKEAKNGDTIMLINRAGCDSIVTLRLTTSSKPIVWDIDTTICDTLFPFTWREYAFTAIYTYRDTIYNARGCDSIYRSFTLDTIHCVRPLPPTPDPPVPPTPDPPVPPVDTCISNLVYRKWVDFIFCDNGRDEFVAFQWYRNNQYLAGETGQYLYLPGTMGAAEYFVEATKTDGSKIRTCPKTFDNTPRSRDTYVKVTTVIRRGEPLQIAMSDPEADIALYTVVGQSVLTAHIQGPETSILLPLPAGTYILRLIGANVNTTTKILIE